MKYIAIAIILLGLLTACEDVINVKLDTGVSQLAVEGWINDQTLSQKVRLTTTTDYFDNSAAPAASGAIVTVSDSKGNIYPFSESSTIPGDYLNTNLQGKIGETYTLKITYRGENFQAVTQLKRVCKIDSVTQEFRKKSAFDLEGYYVLFYARDTVGKGDYYRFKVYRNSILYNKPTNLRVIRDLNTDGLLFIPPIRNSFNPFSSTDNILPYKIGETIRCEVLSIDSSAYEYFNEVRNQINNGGLFASPINNVPTNIQNLNPNSNKKAVGYFYASALSAKEITIKDK